MKHFVVSVFDEAAKAYLPPTVLHREELAQRAFLDAVNSDSHQFGAHPADYTMMVIGVFDDETGEIIPERPRSIGNGLEMKQAKSAAPFDLTEVSL